MLLKYTFKKLNLIILLNFLLILLNCFLIINNQLIQISHFLLVILQLYFKNNQKFINSIIHHLANVLDIINIFIINFLIFIIKSFKLM